MPDSYEGYLNKLKNRLFSCLCERENNGPWQAILDGVLIELSGIPEESRSVNFWSLYYKLSACRYLEFSYFRKTIFDCMTLIGGIEK